MRVCTETPCTTNSTEWNEWTTRTFNVYDHEIDLFNLAILNQTIRLYLTIGVHVSRWPNEGGNFACGKIVQKSNGGGGQMFGSF